MTTRREECLAKLGNVIAMALAPLAADVTLKDRNTALAALLDVLSAGNAKAVSVLLDGDAAQPDALLGDGVIYDHVQTAVFQIASVHDDAAKRATLLDAVLAAVDAAVRADPTLGGMCDFAQCTPPQFSDLDADGVPEGKACELPIEILYSSTSALG